MAKNMNRRLFLGAMSAVTTTSMVRTGMSRTRSASIISPQDRQLALLGGSPVRTKPFPSWPIVKENERQTWSNVLESKKWNRGKYVAEFENRWAEALKAKYVIATSSGTAALCACLNALGVGPGDEVIVPPYTFVATINVVLLQNAIPIFVDSDRATHQIDAEKIEAAITDRTRCIMPVHLGGNPANLDRILEISRNRGIPVIEDACQAVTAEWRSRRVGPLGDVGCYSFQASKNLNSGEGGAIATDNGDLAVRCASFHNAGRPYAIQEDGSLRGDEKSGFAYVRNGDNRRMTEFQASLLIEQLSRLEEQSRRREENSSYLSEMLKEIPGIEPAIQYEGCTRNGYHLYMFRYQKKHFAGIEKARFLEAMGAEGVPVAGGYGPLNREPFIQETCTSRGFRNIYPAEELARLPERNYCPENDKLCEEGAWMGQTVLLGSRQDMEEIVAAIRKVQQRAADLA